MNEIYFPQIYLHFPQSKNNLLLEDQVTIVGRSSKTADIALAFYFEKGDIAGTFGMGEKCKSKT